MALNKSSGNMYSFVNYTINFIKGVCKHNCLYCFMKKFPQKEIRLDEKEFKTNLGLGNFIFVGSSTDMFADNIPKEWIIKVLNYCSEFDNKYLFQSKNPSRFLEFMDYFPDKTTFGTTIETNRQGLIDKYSEAPSLSSRVVAMTEIDRPKTITLEPIIYFDTNRLVNIIEAINPEWINIGADSKNSGLLEPPYDKVKELIKELERFTKVHIKRNLNRLKND